VATEASIHKYMQCQRQQKQAAKGARGRGGGVLQNCTMLDVTVVAEANNGGCVRWQILVAAAKSRGKRST